MILGDSSKTDVLPNGTANYNFMTSFECSPDGPNSLDDIAQKPVLRKYLMLNRPPQRWVLPAALLCLPAAGVTRSRIALQQRRWEGLSTSLPAGRIPFHVGLCSLALLFLLAWGDEAGACAGADTDPLQPLNCWSEAV